MYKFDFSGLLFAMWVGLGFMGFVWIAGPPLAVAGAYWLMAPRFGWHGTWQAVFAWSFVLWIGSHLAVMLASKLQSSRRA